MKDVRLLGAVVTVMFLVAAGFVFPATSVVEPAATVMTAVPPRVPDAVKVTEYEAPEPEKPLSVPKVAVTSDTSNPVTDSAKVIVTLVDAPSASDVDPPKVTDGAVVSRMIESSAETGAASCTPAASVARVYR
ncbi:MAG: hypothetical protein EBT79_13085 [Actinobacteria bacterium]|nr:hypothetical protein [Actinomycetota bacterium]